jgi:hypothetical protein
LPFVSFRLLQNSKPAKLANPTTAKLSAIATNPTFTPAMTGNLTAVVQHRKSSELIKPAAIKGDDEKTAQTTSSNHDPIILPPSAQLTAIENRLEAQPLFLSQLPYSLS